MKEYTIGDVAKQLNLSVDTLRYYEKIGILKNILRTDAGNRIYSKKHVSTLKFIRRAQAMNFSLAEIDQLLQMRENPQQVRSEVRQLTQTKLNEVEERVSELITLKNELTLLVNLCAGSEAGCPIIENIDSKGND